MKKLTRYLLLEFTPIFIMGNVFFIFVLLLQQLVELTDTMLVSGVGLFALLGTIIYFVPSLFSMTIPVSALLAVLLSFNRLSADSEIVALKACGAGPKDFILPTLLFGICSMLLALLFSTVLLAKGANIALFKIGKMLENISLDGFKEKQMYDNLGSMIFYANKKLNDTDFEDVIVINPSDKSVITAKRGAIAPHQNRSILMRFDTGKFTSIDSEADYTVLDFGKLSLNFPLELNTQSFPAGERFMSVRELRKGRDNLLYRYEFAKRLSLPAASVIMSLLGLSLGVFLNRSGQSVGIVLSCLVAVIFNGLFMLFELMAKNPPVAPELLAWLPNIVFTIALIPLLKRAV